MENVNTNIPKVTVDQLHQSLLALYKNAIEKSMPFTRIPVPFLWGPPGVGKSQLVAQLAQNLQAQTGKTTQVTDIRLLLFSPPDLRGIPFADQKREFCDWLPPRIFDMKEGADRINILFLDELSSAAPAVQAAAYQICLDRRVGEHKLPENCVVIAAGNRTTDQSVSYKMPKALRNRLMHFEVLADIDGWRNWAIKQRVDPRIIGYVSFDNSKLLTEAEADDHAYPTPRSWEFVNTVMQLLDGDTKNRRLFTAACVGSDTEMEFDRWVNNHSDLPDVEEILAGSCRRYPKTQDTLLVVMASIVSAVRMRAESISVRQLENVCAYVNHFPVDFAMATYSDLHSIEGVNLRLLRCPSSNEWRVKHKQGA